MSAAGAAPPAGRVLGWDVLRGLCALSVAAYHLMFWQGLAGVHTLGSYGVYMFFVLSGASLAYTYAGKLSSLRETGAFLATRWMRLAPLYGVLCVVFVAMLWLRDGQLVDRLPLRLALNASFAFGFHDPAVWALLVGGWSLGIEFAYYLAFPLLLAALSRPAWSAALAVALAVLQWAWIDRTIGSAAGYEASTVAYHQVPGFAAYFFGGCVIGHWRRGRFLMLAPWGGAVAWAAMAAALLALNPARAGDELLGARGVALAGLCFVAVFVSGQVSLPAGPARIARWLGDITYGCYLLHPMLFFGLAWFVLPALGVAEVELLPWAARCGILAGVLALSCLLAAASERWFEAPLRRWGRRRLSPRPAPAGYREAASISS